MPIQNSATEMATKSRAVGRSRADALVARLKACDAAVVMKLGRHFDKVRAAIEEAGLLARAIYVERGTMDQEQVLPLAEKRDGMAPYFSLILLPGQGRGTDNPADTNIQRYFFLIFEA